MTEDYAGRLDRIAKAYRGKVEAEQAESTAFSAAWKAASAVLEEVLDEAEGRLKAQGIPVKTERVGEDLLLSVPLEGRARQLRYQPDWIRRQVRKTTDLGNGKEKTEESFDADALRRETVADQVCDFLNRALGVG